MIKKPLGRSSRRWNDNISMDLKEIGVNMMNGMVLLRIGFIGELL